MRSKRWPASTRASASVAFVTSSTSCSATSTRLMAWPIAASSSTQRILARRRLFGRCDRTAVEARPTDAALGRWTVKREPFPSSLVTPMSPPSSITMRREMLSPRPVPWPVGFVVKNGSKIRGSTSAGIPEPVSAISTQTNWPSLLATISMRFSPGVPSGSACAALTTRLRNSWPIRDSLASTLGRSSSYFRSTSPRCRIWTAAMRTEESRICRTSTSDATASSPRAKVRRSWTIARTRCAP